MCRAPRGGPGGHRTTKRRRLLAGWEKELDDEFAELGDVDFPLDDSLDDSETAEEIKR